MHADYILQLLLYKMCNSTQCRRNCRCHFYGRMWNSIVSVPEYCLHIYFVSTSFSAASVNKKVFEFLWLEDFNPFQIDSHMFRDNLN